VKKSYKQKWDSQFKNLGTPLIKSPKMFTNVATTPTSKEQGFLLKHTKSTHQNNKSPDKISNISA